MKNFVLIAYREQYDEYDRCGEYLYGVKEVFEIYPFLNRYDLIEIWLNILILNKRERIKYKDAGSVVDIEVVVLKDSKVIHDEMGYVFGEEGEIFIDEDDTGDFKDIRDEIENKLNVWIEKEKERVKIREVEKKKEVAEEKKLKLKLEKKERREVYEELKKEFGE